MAVTFKQLQDDTLNLTQELADVAGFTLDVVKRQINRGYRAFVRKTGCIEDVVNITTVAQQQWYTSSDAANIAFMYKINAVRYVDSDLGRILRPYPGGYDNLPKTKQYGVPDWYVTQRFSTKGKQRIGSWKIENAGSKVLEVKALMFPTADLSADADQADIIDDFTDAIIWYAVWQLFSQYSHIKREWRAKALGHKALFDGAISEYIALTFMEGAGEAPQILDAYGDIDGLLFP